MASKNNQDENRNHISGRFTASMRKTCKGFYARIFPQLHTGDFRLRKRYGVAAIAVTAVVAFCAGWTISDKGISATAQTHTSASAQKTKKTSDSRTDFLRQARSRGVYDAQLNNLVVQSAARIDSLPSKHSVTTSGFNLNVESLNELNQKISAIESSGDSLSFVVTDVATGHTLAYKHKASLYTASAIKGPVVLSDFSQGMLDPAQTAPETAQLVENTIVNSDNESYQQLINSYGLTALHNWTAGVSLDAEIGRTKYTWLSAADFAKMWVLGYDYLFTTQDMESDPAKNTQAFRNAALNDDHKQWFADYYTHTANSFIQQALDNTVYAKAGWINNDEYFLAQNDAGIVKSDLGDYVMVVMSSAYGQYDKLANLVSTLASIHDGQMVAQ
ncbi:hypothetical protein [Alloscardovia omnicolens]|uniref:hypothetical protein n=1 Tax=Alloscardovia omnicolens TaxID=419015 RepID=UPI003A75E7C3